MALLRPTVILTVLLLAGCAEPSPEPSVQPSLSVPPEAPPPASVQATPSPTPEPTDVLIAAGDIAACDEEGDSATAALVAELEGTVATLGDTVYPYGSDTTYAECYDPLWGEFLDRTRPAMGNHDAQEDGGAAYFRYFGDAAGTPGEGWYSYDLGAWHVIVLNSNCGLVGCDVGSPQHQWLTDDVAGTDAACTLVYWHHPLFSSGPHGNLAELAPLWDTLDKADADVVLDGHDHLYERFAPQTAAGVADAGGLRQLTVGTGGKALYAAERVAPNSELMIDDAFGVLVLTLAPDSYSWKFLTVDGNVADSGSSPCVGA